MSKPERMRRTFSCYPYPELVDMLERVTYALRDVIRDEYATHSNDHPENGNKTYTDALDMIISIRTGVRKEQFR